MDEKKTMGFAINIPVASEMVPSKKSTFASQPSAEEEATKAYFRSLRDECVRKLKEEFPGGAFLDEKAKFE